MRNNVIGTMRLAEAADREAAVRVFGLSGAAHSLLGFIQGKDI